MAAFMVMDSIAELEAKALNNLEVQTLRICLLSQKEP